MQTQMWAQCWLELHLVRQQCQRRGQSKEEVDNVTRAIMFSVIQVQCRKHRPGSELMESPCSHSALRTALVLATATLSVKSQQGHSCFLKAAKQNG